MTSSSRRKLTIFFNDGTKIVTSFPKQFDGDPSIFASQVRKAIEADRLVMEIQGALVIIPTRNVKYFQLTPAPEVLPQGVIRGATLLS